jgi:hypothetical protein
VLEEGNQRSIRGNARMADPAGSLVDHLTDRKLKTVLASLVDHAHSPTAKFFDYSIMGDGFANHT